MFPIRHSSLRVSLSNLEVSPLLNNADSLNRLRNEGIEGMINSTLKSLIEAHVQFGINSGSPMDCKWSDFTQWSGCSKSCNAGIQTRERHIVMLARNGGKHCEGEDKETRFCNIQQCPRKDLYFSVKHAKDESFR